MMNMAKQMEEKRKKQVEGARLYAQIVAKAQRAETETIFKSALDQPIHDTVISSEHDKEPDTREESQYATNEPIFEEPIASSPEQQSPEHEGDSSMPISRSDFNRLKQKLDVILRIIDRP